MRRWSVAVLACPQTAERSGGASGLGQEVKFDEPDLPSVKMPIS